MDPLDPVELNHIREVLVFFTRWVGVYKVWEVKLPISLFGLLSLMERWDWKRFCFRFLFFTISQEN